MSGDGPASAQAARPGPEQQQPTRPSRPSLVEQVRRAPVAWLIIAINVIVFVLAERSGSTTRGDTLVRFGAVWRGLVWQGEYWRLATSMFLHIGVVHLLWNGYYGLRLSAQTEHAIGTSRFLALYVLSGIAGAAASVIGHDAVSAGASGALFGLIGWQLVVGRARTGSFRAMWGDPGVRRDLTWIGAWFVIGIFAGFDNYAHAGGLGFGLLFSWALMARRPHSRTRLAVVLVSLAALVALSLSPLPLIHARQRVLWKAYRAQRDPTVVLALTEPLLASDSRIEAQRVRAQALVALGRFQDAMVAADEVIGRNPGDATAYVIRGGARKALGDGAGAELDFQRALALDASTWTRETIARYRSQRAP
jgi:membrane associated rhomboid family serine protease